MRRGRATAVGAALWLALWCLLSVGLAGGVPAQESPRRLPPPDVPVEELKPPVESSEPAGTPAMRPASQPATQPGELYLGPPSGIDGPVRLPPPEFEVLPDEIAPGITPEGEVLFPDSPLESELYGNELYGDEFYYERSPKLSDFKDGFFQKLSLSAAWYGNSQEPDDLGGTEIETFLTVALPAPIKEWPLFIKPGYNMTLIDGPTITDLPPRLYFAYVEFTWLPQIVHRYRLLLSVAPNVFGDFQANEFRLTGSGFVIYDWVPDRLQFIAGVLYLNRDNIRLLPAGGVIWTPSDWSRFELLFPKPKLALRYNVGHGYEDWLFTTAEFGGNTWPIERATGMIDDVTYQDYRILVGFERKLNGGAGYRLEGGWVFGRSIEFASHVGDFDPRDTFILRGGITY
jgi:hypothetical protein